MSTINERVGELRRYLKLSQAKFGDRILLTGPTVHRMETGVAEVTGQTKKIICSEFNVDSHWLLTGEGEMFINYEDEFEQLLEGMDEDHKILFRSIRNLPSEKIRSIREFAKEIVEQEMKNT